MEYDFSTWLNIAQTLPQDILPLSKGCGSTLKQDSMSKVKVIGNLCKILVGPYLFFWQPHTPPWRVLYFLHNLIQTILRVKVMQIKNYREGVILKTWLITGRIDWLKLDWLIYLNEKCFLCWLMQTGPRMKVARIAEKLCSLPVTW